MKIPPQAKKVFEGVIFDVYQWDQEMYDGSIEIFEKLKRADTVTIIATHDDKVYLSRQIQPDRNKYFFSCFGGRVDMGEDPLEAAKRELLEEAGMSSDDWNLLTSDSLISKIDWSTYIYIAKNCQTVAPQKLDNGEKIEIIEMGFEEFLDKIYDEEFRGLDIRLHLTKHSRKDPLFSTFKGMIF